MKNRTKRIIALNSEEKTDVQEPFISVPEASVVEEVEEELPVAEEEAEKTEKKKGWF
jgi:hypothetical protein